MRIEDAVALFIDALQAEGAAAETIRGYRHHLRCFLASLPAHHQTVDAWVTSDVTRFIAGERQRGLAETSIYDCYRALDRFFNWCADSKEVGRPPSPLKNQEGKRIFKVKKPKRKKPRRAKVETVDALIEALPQENWIQRRNRVALRLLRDTGIRLGEAVNVRLSDLDLTERVLTIPDTKNGEYRLVCFTPACVEEILSGTCDKVPKSAKAKVL